MGYNLVHELQRDLDRNDQNTVNMEKNEGLIGKEDDVGRQVGA